MKLSRSLEQWQDDEDISAARSQWTDECTAKESQNEGDSTDIAQVVFIEVSIEETSRICRDLPPTLCEVTIFDDDEQAVRQIGGSVPDLIVCPWATWETLGDRIGFALSQHQVHRPVLVLLMQATSAASASPAAARDHRQQRQSIQDVIRLVADARGSDRAKTLARADITLDPLTRRVTRGDRTVRLSQTTFHLLQILMAEPERVHSREELLRGLRGERIHLAIRTIDVHVKRLRQELNVCGGPDVIRTVRGVGYAFSHPAGWTC